MNEISSFFFGKMADFLPAFLLKMIFRPEKLASRIRIRLRDEKPISPNLEKEVPEINVYFDITNLTYFKLVLDRALINLWYGQPTLQGSMLKRHTIPPKTISPPIFYRSHLTQAQCQQIRNFLNKQDSSGRIQLHITAYFESKVGIIEKEENLRASI